MIPSYVRCAAGVCVLSTGLLLGGPAVGVAIADTDTGGSTTTTGDSTESAGEVATPTATTGPTTAAAATTTAATTTSTTTAVATTMATAATTGGAATTAPPAAVTTPNIVGSITDTLKMTIRGITTTFGSGRSPGQHASVGATDEEILPTGSNAREDDAGPAAAVANEADNSGAAFAAATTTPSQEAAAASDVVSAVAADVSAAADQPAAHAIGAKPPGNGDPDQLIGPFQDMVTSVSGAVGEAFHVIGPFQDMLLSVSRAVGFTGVIAPVQTMLGAYSEMYPKAAPYIEPFQEWLTWVDTTFARPLDSELSMLFGMAWNIPRVDIAPGVANERPMTLGVPAAPPAPAPVAATLPSDFLPLPAGTTPLATAAASVAALGIATTYMDHVSSVPVEAAVVSNSPIPLGVQKFFREAFRELVKSPSLAALAATALPGVAGIIILTAAGVRLGYRQAKAQLALTAAGIARFAGPGPLGVVRSGSFISVPASRTPRAGRPLRSARPTGLAAVIAFDRAA